MKKVQETKVNEKEAILSGLNDDVKAVDELVRFVINSLNTATKRGAFDLQEAGTIATNASELLKRVSEVKRVSEAELKAATAAGSKE